MSDVGAGQLVRAEPVGVAAHFVIKYGRQGGWGSSPPRPPEFDIVVRGREGERAATVVFQRAGFFAERLEVAWEPVGRGSGGAS